MSDKETVDYSKLASQRFIQVNNTYGRAQLLGDADDVGCIFEVAGLDKVGNICLLYVGVEKAPCRCSQRYFEDNFVPATKENIRNHAKRLLS